MPSVSRFRARPLLAAVLALGLLGAPAAGGTAAAAADDAVELTPATVDLFASPREPVLHDDDSELQIDVLVGNPGEQPLPETAVEVALDPRPLETIDDLDGVFPEHPIELAEGHRHGAARSAALHLRHRVGRLPAAGRARSRSRRHRAARVAGRGLDRQGGRER
jgi:hypothetical protein